MTYVSDMKHWLRMPLLAVCMVSSASHAQFDLFDNDPEGHVDEPPMQLGDHPVASNTEKMLPPDEIFNLYIQDETFFKPREDDRIEKRKVNEQETKTIKVENAIEPIRFASGQEDIPEEFVTKLQNLLDKMRDRHNVRVHFVGHTDSDKLGGALKEKYGDNYGLSTARAEIAAEFFKAALNLPPEAISYDGAGDSKPIASNKTAAGKRQNRRVEIQIWYDEITDKEVEKEVLIKADRLNRLKVCRKEVVCKLKYREGNARRARLKNLVSPLRQAEGVSDIPDEFYRQIREVLENLSNKENVVVKFIGHTDNLPLEGRQARIYGNQEGFSKARARRVALSVQDKLGLTNYQVDSTGKGFSRPVTSNDTEKGRALNRRIEVEFWHDDPFEEYSAEPQACPERDIAETVTVTYDPLTGPVEPIRFVKGKPNIPSGYTARLKRLIDEVSDKSNVRLRFTGYTNNERLERRVAMVYGDDIGLSTSRARRASEAVRQEMGLDEDQVEYEGRGYVHSKDVVNTGFVQFDTARVEVEVVYDELAALEENEGLEITRIEREAIAQNPYSLNLMRITVDGEPVYDPYKSTEDIQRCVDVELEKADIQFTYDNLKTEKRLNVTAWPNTIRYQDVADTKAYENRVEFKVYNNYPTFIKTSQVRLFKDEQSVTDEPVAIAEVDVNGKAEWFAQLDSFDAPLMKYKYVLRVYDENGRYDETDALPLWVVDKLEPKQPGKQSDKQAGERSFKKTSKPSSKQSDNPLDKSLDLSLDNLLSNPLDKPVEKSVDKPSENALDNPFDKMAAKELLVGYGESHLARNDIPLSGGTVKVTGNKIPKDHSVWLAGRQVPVNSQGEFIAEEIFAPGYHSVEVAVLDKGGNGELFMRDLSFDKSDWFYVGLADITFTKDSTNGPAALVTGDTAHYDNDLAIDGRLAFYVEGVFGDDWELIASADTQEGPLDDIFSNFLDKNPNALFRRIDPDYFYPTFGDDSTVVENAPTSGKLFFKLKHHDSFGMWGNFKLQYTDTELAHVDRGLFGGNIRYESDDSTSFGEKAFVADIFAAEPGTRGGRDEFRGTGGSLYFLRHQDVAIGSERVRIEIRDKDSGLVLGVKDLIAAIDYDIDYLQGRILLNEPLSGTASDNLIVSNGSFAGNPVYLVVRYEYTSGFEDIKDLAVGGRVHYWFNDYVKLGLTSSRQEEDGVESILNGVDFTFRKNAGTWLKLELASTEGTGTGILSSNDGGFSFTSFDLDLGATTDTTANAYRMELSTKLSDMVENARGTITFYVQNREAGFAAPGQLTDEEVDQYGGHLDMAITEDISLDVKVDSREKENGLSKENGEVDVSYKLDENWRLSSGLRVDSREDNSATVAVTQTEGVRSDLAFHAHYDSKEHWTGYGFVQGTVNTTETREDNDRVGLGGTYRATDRLNLEGELSGGDQGTGIKLGSEYLMSDRTNLYINYALENERTDNGIRSKHGSANTGFRSRYSDTVSVYGEERYAHGDVPTGLTHAAGVDIAPDDEWNYGVSLETGTLVDDENNSEIERLAAGFTLGYKFEDLKYGGALEYRSDNNETLDAVTNTINNNERKTWLWKNSFKYQISDEWRFLGKLNISDSESTLGEFYDGKFTEAVLGYGYRPIRDDRWNTLFKYTYFFNVPTTDQVTIENTAAEFIQKSHIISLDTIYDISQRWSIGGKYAHRKGELSTDRVNPVFFESNANLYVLRIDWHFVNKWDLLIEGRKLEVPEAQDSRQGTLLGIYRHIGKNFKFGLGYNFTDFSDDLTDLDYDSKGFFINLVGKI